MSESGKSDRYPTEFRVRAEEPRSTAEGIIDEKSANSS
jgi:hypothetical protein